MPRKPPREQPRTLSYVVGFIALVLLPAFITAIAPVSVTRFERRGSDVSADVKTNVFFVIPYRHVQIEAVTAVDDRFHAGELVENTGFSRSDSRHTTRSEDEAFLVIHGRDKQAEVSVSPANIRGVMEKARTFLASPNERELRLITVANWKFGVFAGGFLSLFTALYVFGLLLGLWRLITGHKPSPAAEPPHRWKPQ